MPNDTDARNAARKLRAAVRAGHMTVEVVALGQCKPSPYASSTPEERLAAAVRLIEHHQAPSWRVFEGPTLCVAG